MQHIKVYILLFKKYSAIIPTTYTHFIDLDDVDHLLSLSKAANDNYDANLDVTVAAPCSVGDCDEMIHSEAKFGAHLMLTASLLHQRVLILIPIMT